MALLRFITFSLLGVHVSANLHVPVLHRRNVAPQETKLGFGVPTPSPPAPTDAARLPEMELRNVLIPRQQGCASFSRGRATCGYLYDGEPVDCYSTDHCATSGRYLGCCSASGCDVTPAVYYTGCMDYSSCVSRSLSDSYLRCCRSIEHPFCVTAVSFATVGISSGSLLSFFICGNNVISGIQTLSGTPSAWDATCTPTPSTPSSRPIVSTTTTSTTTPTPTDPPAPGPSTGAIAGGVVGGLAGLALIILAIWYAFRRGRRGAEQSQPEAPPPPQQPYTTPGPPNPSPDPQQYQPPMAYAPAPAPPPMAPGPTQYATQYATQPAEPVYQQSPGSDLSTPYWPGSAGDGSIRKSPFEEQVVVTSVPTSPGSPGSAQAASFPSSPNPRASQFSSWTAPTAVGSPREAAHFVELGVERADGELRELKA